MAQPQENEAKLCNCRRSAECPVEGKCLQQSVIYKAEVLSKHGTKTYFGMTERAFKQRYTEHKQSLPSRTSRMDPVERKKKYEHKSELSAYAWKLQGEGTGYRINWRIHSKAYPYRGGGRRCDLCLTEKLVIALADPNYTFKLKDRTNVKVTKINTFLEDKNNKRKRYNFEIGKLTFVAKSKNSSFKVDD